jgi:hypothetical protein
MPIVEKTSNLIHAGFGSATPEPDPARARGRPIVAAGRVDNAADDSQNSKYHLVDLPADAIMDARTAMQVENWGFATVSIGTDSDVDAIISVAKSAGTVASPFTQFGAQFAKPLWEALGLSAPPDNGMISIYAHGPANATGAGHMLFEFHYRFR